jgi:predicted ABC-class ATPase
MEPEQIEKEKKELSEKLKELNAKEKEMKDKEKQKKKEEKTQTKGRLFIEADVAERVLKVCYDWKKKNQKDRSATSILTEIEAIIIEAGQKIQPEPPQNV